MSFGHSYKQALQCLGNWTFDELIPLICLPTTAVGKRKVLISTPNHGDFLIKVGTTRLNCFIDNHVCVRCGREGVIWCLERQEGEMTPHLNLYAIVKKDELRLMTKDHIVPQSKGGLDNRWNLQTMCVECNFKKGSGQ